MLVEPIQERSAAIRGFAEFARAEIGTRASWHDQREHLDPGLRTILAGQGFFRAVCPAGARWPRIRSDDVRDAA
ncbi:hypothetical protein [Fodinicola feengrottensis]|uniref:hypothetical protein n=1 Tax=Fodinicola feengrottensis TaxID=435914 RepID=UPI0024431840|nr:hypothetical protein [Fodinicola feengrottensis]